VLGLADIQRRKVNSAVGGSYLGLFFLSVRRL
jgi:hypothetical protein